MSGSRYSTCMRYTTQQIADLFAVSHQTVKNYCAEFAAYLSPTATPEKGQQRQFTDDDVAVLALVVEMKKAGAVFESIHHALGMGQRGDVPDAALIPIEGDGAGAGGAALLVMRQQVIDLQTALAEKERELAGRDAQIALLREMLNEAQRQVINLERKNARLEDHDD